MRNLPGTDAPIGQPDISAPSLADIERLHADGTLEMPAAPAPAPRPHRLSIAERVAREDRWAEAHRNVEAGKADPTLFEVLADAERSFRPNDEVLAEAVKGQLGKDANAGRWLRRYLSGWFDSKARDPVTGAAIGNEAGDASGFVRGLANSAMVFSSRVCVGFDRSGPGAIELEKSSGVPLLDRMAEDSVQAAATRTWRPDVPDARACYVFNAELTRTPPLPILACILGGRFGVTCVYPLKEIFRTWVRLDGVEFPRESPG